MTGGMKGRLDPDKWNKGWFEYIDHQGRHIYSKGDIYAIREAVSIVYENAINSPTTPVEKKITERLKGFSLFKTRGQQ